jgi:hypothetical protein
VKGTRAIAAGLAVAACVLLVSLAPGSWPLVLLWALASVLVGVVWERLVSIRLALAVALLPLCVLLTFEGGLFLIPSVIALIVASIPGHRRATA